MKTTIGLLDDHYLFVESLSLMLEKFNEYEVVVEAANGNELQEKFKHLKSIPELMLIDVNMPVMGGVETAKWLHLNYPAMKLVALSMNNSDQSILEMIKAGCCAYLLKDTRPLELKKALEEIITKGYYNCDATNINYRRLIQIEKEALLITPNEKQFLQLACSDMTYKQIASIMQLSEKTIDGYRSSLFQKLHVQSRVAMCLEAIRKELANL